ncbi:MAG: VanZ family protein [Rubritalea sp.]|jgi:VanZ family protein
MFKFPDWCYGKLPSNNRFWIGMWLTWAAVLWWLSSGNPEIKDAPKIPHLDKVAHFCYFMAGGFCFANSLFLKRSVSWSGKRILLITLLAGAAMGAIDEYHQTKTPGRTGNDLGDWCADVSGTLAGAYYCLSMWNRLRKNNQYKFKS